MPRPRTLRVKRALSCAAVALVGLTTGACTALDNALAAMPFFTHMRESPAFDPYEAPRPAPPNSVPYLAPQGAVALEPIVPTDAGLNAFAGTVTNPVPANEAVLATGQALYDRLCSVCHGPTGTGNGPAVGPNRFPYAPNLSAPVTVQRSDGYIYGIIRGGRGLMPPYATQTTHMERWFIVEYVRLLQRQSTEAGTAAPGAAAPPTSAPAAAQEGQ